MSALLSNYIMIKLISFELNESDKKKKGLTPIGFILICTSVLDRKSLKNNGFVNPWILLLGHVAWN